MHLINAHNLEANAKKGIGASQCTQLTISNGCEKLKYHYILHKKTQLLTEFQKTISISFAPTLLKMCSKNEINLSLIIFCDESRFIQGNDKQWWWLHYGQYNPTALAKYKKFLPSILNVWSHLR